MIYKFKTAFVNPKASPQVVGERFELLKKENGLLSPQIIVDDARPIEAPLHPCFEWEDKIAAEEYRKQQAGKMLRHLIIVIKKNKTDLQTRAYVNIKTEEGRGYIPINIVLSQPDLKEQLLETALKDIEIWQNKYNTLKELSSLYEVINKEKRYIKEKYKIRQNDSGFESLL